MKFFKKGELKLLWPFYLDSILSPMLYLIAAFYILFFLDLGFSMFQIGILISAIPLFALIFEIPTGAIADIYGRKKSVLLGTLIEGVAISLVFFSNSFFAILACLALAGFGSTFVSGASEAWVTDLIKNKKKDYLTDYYSKQMSFDSFGLVVSGILGALMVKNYGLDIIWLISGLSFFLSFLILLPAKEIFNKNSKITAKSFEKVKNQSFESIKFAKKNRKVHLFLMAGIFIIVSAGFGSEISWTPLLKDLGLSVHNFGYLWSAMASLGIIAPLVSNKYLKKGKELKFIIKLNIISFLVLLPIIFVTTLPFGIIIMSLIVFFSFMIYPADEVYFQNIIPTKKRATLGSVRSMTFSIAMLIATPLAGLSVDLLGPRYTILISAFIMIPAIILYSKIKE